jgi:hypothetical protein
VFLIKPIISFQIQLERRGKEILIFSSKNLGNGWGHVSLSDLKIQEKSTVDMMSKRINDFMSLATS